VILSGGARVGYGERVPEMIEVELYRRLAERAVGRTIVQVEAGDSWFNKGATSQDLLDAALVGSRFVNVRRIGKLLLADTDNGHVLGLRFGMTGRLVVDGLAGIDGLLYTSDRDLAAWERFGLRFADGGSLAIRDPRRLGGVELDPDTVRLGPDAAGISQAALEEVLHSQAPLKAVLLNQRRISGIGNLLADEMLWRAGLSPVRAARSLSSVEARALRTAIRRTIRVLSNRGGSHTGDVMVHRAAGAQCPHDGYPMRHSTVGGRSTWWCEHHQV
jgi:formamidopyrimidine-DNA glycosylase